MGGDHLQLHFFDDGTCELCVRFKEWVAVRDMGGVVEAVSLSREGVDYRFPMEKFLRVEQELTACDGQGGM